MLEQEAAQIVVELNQAYMAAAAELCRKNAELASILLHLPEKDVEALAHCTMSDLNRLSKIPMAIVHPHRSMRRIFGATSPSALLAPMLSALDPGEGTTS